MVRIDNISPWTVLLCAFWPAADTLLSIFRRVWAKVPMMSADREHFHHVIMDFLNKIPAFSGNINITNPLYTLVQLPFMIFPAAIGIYYYESPIQSFAYFVIFMFLYVTAYYSLKNIYKKLY
jgi:hypothetical protein